MTLSLRELARTDLQAIEAYIRADNPEAADRFKAAVQRSLEMLVAHPYLGPRPAFRTRHGHLRFWPVDQFHNYLIFYEPTEDTVDLLRVLPGMRDLPRQLRRGT